MARALTSPIRNRLGPSSAFCSTNPTDCAAAFDALRAIGGVDPDRCGALGFCLGGQCVLELARSGAEACAVVSLHGMLGTRMPAVAGAVKSSVLVLTGARDPYAPLSDVEAFRREMADAQVNHHLTLYGEGWHAFSDEEAATMAHVRGVRHDPLLARLSWNQSLAFLEAYLMPGT